MGIQLWKGTRKRGDWPRMSGRMMAVLHALYQSKQVGYPFAPVDADLRTLHALIRHDWIVESQTEQTVQYALTGRGLKAYQVYAEPPRYRRDGLCPACKQAPVYTTGTTAYDYCLPCYRAKQQAHKQRRKAEQMAERMAEKMARRPGHLTRRTA